ncbi:MAG: hypothetical protein EZS28_048678, partial [Streblomastix strix]
MGSVSESLDQKVKIKASGKSDNEGYLPVVRKV